MEEDKITFIIPTINRDSLSSAINSIKNQTSSNWKIIVAGDGFVPMELKQENADNRILFIASPRKQSAGEVRNWASKFVMTEWVGFLDDDDELYPEYVSKWNELKNLSDVIIFKMENYGDLVPHEAGNRFLEASEIKYGNIGISFCMKTECFKLCKFDNEQLTGSGEDYRMIDELYKNNYSIYFSDYIGYHVRKYLKDV